MPRFVVLFHEPPADFARGEHFDLMLERGAVLATWALPHAPDSPEPQIVEALGDHRLAYLDYQGPISGDRGTVTRWDSGEYRLESRQDDRLVVTLSGERLRGIATLAPLDVGAPLDEGAPRYRFSFSPE